MVFIRRVRHSDVNGETADQNTPHQTGNDGDDEPVVVRAAHTVIQPAAVVIELFDAFVAL